VLQISANKDTRVIIQTQAELDPFGSTYFQPVVISILPEKSVGTIGTSFQFPQKFCGDLK